MVLIDSLAMKRKNRGPRDGAAEKKLRPGDENQAPARRSAGMNTAVFSSVADGSQLPIGVVPVLDLSAPEIGHLKDKLQRGVELEKPHDSCKKDASAAWNERKNSGKKPDVSGCVFCLKLLKGITAQQNISNILCSPCF